MSGRLSHVELLLRDEALAVRAAKRQRHQRKLLSPTSICPAIPGLGQPSRSVMGRHVPAMTMVQVVALIEDRAKVEIEATAVLPS